MKRILTLLAISLLITNIQCSSSNDSKNKSDIQNDEITQAQLDEKKQEVLDYINSFQCTDSCNFIAFGSKPCGGPWEYLAFSSSVNLETLQTMVTEYNELQHEFNVQTEAISDCALVMPPNEVNCVSGICTVIN
jgi:hypothetical protein